MRKTHLARILALALLFSSASAQQVGKWVSAYYAGWQSSHLPPSEIDFSAFTHLLHFSVYPIGGANFEGTLNGLNPAHMTETVQLTHAAGKKIILSVGGWGSDFTDAVSATYRDQSIRNLVSYMSTYGYDGIDIDWEPINDPTGFAVWIKQLHAAMRVQNPNCLLTIACGYYQPVADNYAEFDQINIMTYDCAGPFPGWVVWHNAPVYDGGFRFPSTGGQIPAADNYVQFFLDRGVPKEKLAIGTDFLGYYWWGGEGTSTGGATAPRQSWTVAPSVRGNVQYYEIMDTYEGHRVLWDSIAQATYISIDNVGSSNDRFISFDDERAIFAKAEYVRNKGIGGIILFEIGSGYRTNQPAGQKDILLQAVKDAFMLGKTFVLDVTPPTVSLTTPTNGATVNGTISISAEASDNSGIVFVQFALDGALYHAPLKVGPFTVSLNSWKLVNGTHTLMAIARDRSGNCDTSSVIVTVNNQGTPPTVPPMIVYDETLQSPFMNTSWGAKADFANTDVVRSGSLAIRVDFSDWGALDLNSGSWSTLQPIDPLVYDTLRFDVYPLAQFDLTVGFYNGSELAVHVTANTWNHVVLPLTFLDTFTRFFIQRNLLGAGVAFFDNIMFTGFGGGPAAPPRDPDSIKPTISLLAPVPNATLSGLTSIAAIAFDNIGVAGVRYRIDGQNYGAEDISRPYEVSVNTWYLANGPHVFSAVARDGSGNRDSVSVPVVVTNSGTPPSFDLIVFDDDLEVPFQNISWGATVTTSADTVFAGLRSARVVYTGWGAWDLLSGAWGALVPISPGDFDSLSFEVYPTSSFKLDVGFYNTYQPTVSLVANRWNHVAVPLAFDTVVTRFFFRRDTMGTTIAFFDNVKFVAKPAGDKTDLSETSAIPVDFSLEQNYPNPFNPTTTLVFSLPRPCLARLQVFDLLGREVATLVDGELLAGVHRISFDASKERHLASGIYLYRLQAADFVLTRRMIVLR